MFRKLNLSPMSGKVKEVLGTVTSTSVLYRKIKPSIINKLISKTIPKLSTRITLQDSFESSPEATRKLSRQPLDKLTEGDVI